jgi:hypothetical protein
MNLYYVTCCIPLLEFVGVCQYGPHAQSKASGYVEWKGLVQHNTWCTFALKHMIFAKVYNKI